MEIFKGYCPAIVTPFSKSGKQIDYNHFEKLIEFQITNGASAIVFLGTTGESSTLSLKEKISVVEFAIKTVLNRVPIIIGAGGNNTNEVINFVKILNNYNINGLLIVTPYYNKCTQTGLIKHYSLIAKNTHLPIILYNVPSRTSVNILPSTVLILSKIKNIVAIKEASGNIEQVSDILSLVDTNFKVYSGDDSLTLPIIALGGIGVISVVGNIIPYEMNLLCNLCLNNNFEDAKILHLKYYKLMKSMFLEVNPIPVKTALKILNKCNNTVRLPLCKMEQLNLIKLKQTLLRYFSVSKSAIN